MAKIMASTCPSPHWIKLATEVTVTTKVEIEQATQHDVAIFVSSYIVIAGCGGEKQQCKETKC